MSVEQRVIVGPDDRERTAIVSVPIPAGGEVQIDRTWRFIGWRDDMKIKVKREPKRIDVMPPEGLGGDWSDDPLGSPPEDGE